VTSAAADPVPEVTRVTSAAAEPAPAWTVVCRYRDLQPERGAAALIGREQVAVFRMFDGALYAIGNQDPFTGAFVLSRGIVGSRGDIPTVASPLHKQVFDLRTGSCLDDETVAVPVYGVRQRDGLVEVVATESRRGAAPQAPRRRVGDVA
jgi:nitrite reductase (NADH) small subunit